MVTIPNGFPDGSNLILYGTTNMTQIGGMAFTISSSTGTGFSLLGLDASSFASPATNVQMTFIPRPPPVKPRFFYITKIDRGVSTIVTLSQIHNYIPSQLVRFSVPSSFRMTEIDSMTGLVTDVTPYTLTVSIQSINFTPFAFPASNPSSPFPQTYKNSLFATLSPAGGRNEYNLTSIPFQSTGA